MKRLLRISTLGLAISLVLAACAPAAGRPVLKYQAQAPEVISAIAEIAVTMQPNNSYNFFSINAISDRFITLQAETTGGASIFFGSQAITLTFSASQSGDVTTLAVSSKGNRSTSDNSIDQIIQQLDVRFDRAPLL